MNRKETNPGEDLWQMMMEDCEKQKAGLKTTDKLYHRGDKAVKNDLNKDFDLKTTDNLYQHVDKGVNLCQHGDKGYINDDFDLNVNETLCQNSDKAFKNDLNKDFDLNVNETLYPTIGKSVKIIIDDEVKNRLWKLNETEYENLKQSIVNEGCRDAIVVWNNILIDGHNRYEICKENNIEFKIIEKEFKDKNEALKWVDTNQLSRRNLLDWQRDILFGRISKIVKNQGKRTDLLCDNLSQSSVAVELGINRKTLQRAEKFTDAFETIEKNIGKDKAVELATKLTKSEMLQVGKLDISEQEDIITRLNSRTKYKSGTSIVKEIEKEKHFEERKTTNPLNIKMYNDDCRNILKDIPDGSIDCILTDPPYGIDFLSSWKGQDKKEFDDTKDTILPLLDNVCKLLQKKCKADAHLYFFSSWMSYSYFESIISLYFDISNVIIWEKNNTSLVDFNKRYGFSYEQIIFCKQKGNNNRMLKNKSSRDVIHFDRVANPDHTCEKPVDLLEYFIDNSTVENELVVDLFAGTFNSMVAARNLKRSYIGVEIDYDFYKKGLLK